MITVEIVLGMRFIHKKKFIHRDLKPTNILLDIAKHVRISDFGLAKEESIETSQSKGIGTLRFMAPELFEEKEEEEEENDDYDDYDDDEKNISYTNKVDVYSFGITLIFIVTGIYPKFSLKNVSIGKIPNILKTVVNWVREMIVSCLSVSPENRPSSAEIFENMKENNYDLFNDKTSTKLTSKQREKINEIQARILEIEAYEYQHRDD